MVTRKRRKAEKPKHRKSDDGLHLWLLRLIQRIDSGNPSNADLKAAALLLRMIARDEDPCALIWSTVRNRPKETDPRKYHAAFAYHARVKFCGAQSGKALLGQIADEFGLRDAQVDHAIREHGPRADVESLDCATAVAMMHSHRLSSRRKK